MKWNKYPSKKPKKNGQYIIIVDFIDSAMILGRWEKKKFKIGYFGQDNIKYWGDMPQMPEDCQE